MKQRKWYSYIEVYGCPKHKEAKLLTNKLYARWNAASDKLCDEVLSPDPSLARINSLIAKIDKLWIEIENLRKGINKCCNLWPV